MQKMTFLDLFSGIGGFRLAMEQAGNTVTVPVVHEIAKRMEMGEQEWIGNTS